MELRGLLVDIYAWQLFHCTFWYSTVHIIKSLFLGAEDSDPSHRTLPRFGHGAQSQGSDSLGSSARLEAYDNLTIRIYYVCKIVEAIM